MNADHTPTPPLCPLEARLEELLQIELAEDLEAIPMITEHGRLLRAIQDAMYQQQQALQPIGAGRGSAWRLREAEKKLVEARAWIETHLREMSHGDD